MTFYLGLLSGVGLFMIVEPLVVNFIYFSNISLFRDVILTKKNRKKLDEYYSINR